MQASGIPEIYESLDLPKSIISVSKKQGEFLYNFIKEHNIKNTLEVGFCYGCSAAYIIAATQSIHYAVDPHQEEVWENVGWKNLKNLNFDKFLKLEENFSYAALPKLLNEGLKMDLIFIDGDHKFEAIMLDFYYSNLLLNLGGYVLFDDTYLRSTQTMAEWIKTNRKDYEWVTLPEYAENFVMFKKTGIDKRGMEDFEDFNIPLALVSPKESRPLTKNQNVI